MVGESSEEEIEVVEVVVEAVEEASSQLDPSTLGVPGLKTLVPGDRVEVLWTHGVPCLFAPTPCLLTSHAYTHHAMLLTVPCLLTTPTLPCAYRTHTVHATPRRRHARRAGWERGRVKECVLEMRDRDETLHGMRSGGTPVIIYHITYDDGEKVPSTIS